MRIRYHPLARQDVTDILEAGHEVAVEFFSELTRMLRFISTTSNLFPEIRTGIRRGLLTKFPYEIGFEILNSTDVKILVIKHQRRSPEFGLDR